MVMSWLQGVKPALLCVFAAFLFLELRALSILLTFAMILKKTAG
jgi:hypothetical protein